MSSDYKPDGHSTVSPYLIIADAAGTIEFLKRVIDATEILRMADPTGRILHAELSIGDSVVMLADATESWPASSAHVHVYVPDVDRAYEKALEYGARPIQAPMQQGDPDRRAGVRDAGGTTWWIASRVS